MNRDRLAFETETPPVPTAMVTVLCMDIEPETLAKLQRHRRPPILREAASPAHLIAALEHDPTATELLVLGREVHDPLRLVHHAHALDEDLAVLLLAKPESLDSLREALGFLPSMRGDVSCASAEDTEALSTAIEEAAKRTQKRRIFRAMSSASAARLEGAILENPLCAPFLVRLLDHTPVGTAVLNPQGRIQLVNPAAIELLELCERDSIGRSFVLLFPELEWERLSSHLARCSATERRIAGEVFPCTTPSGRERYLEVSAAPFPGARRERGTLVFLEDRTQSRERGAWLDRRAREVHGLSDLADFALEVARRFHDPLASIVTGAESLHRGLDSDPALAAGLEWIRDEARKAADVAEQLLTFAGHKPLRLASVDLCEVARAALGPVAATLPRRIMLTDDLKADLPTVLADAEHVSAILKNLLSRAAEELGEHAGRIEVTSGVADPRPGRGVPGDVAGDPPAGPCVYLEVTARARGAEGGADPAPEARAERPAKADLALAAVLGAARGQGVALEVDLAAPQGSSVRVLFPLHSSAPPQGEEDQAAGTILLLCQEADSLAVTDKLLEHFGFTVLSTSDPAEARAILRSRGHVVDAVLLDAEPGELAPELVAELARPDLSVILATGEQPQPAALAPFGLEPAAFLAKPFTAELLIRTVRGVLHPH